MKVRPHYYSVRWKGSFISHIAALVTVTSPSFCTTLTNSLFERRTSAPELGSRGCSQN
jgi:hypothetical protein